MSATIKDVSKLSGLSTATISRAFAEPDKVREATRQRVFEAAQALRYQPNAIGRAMAMQRTETIAFVICKEQATILDEFYAAICEGIMDEVNQSDYQLLISTAAQWRKAEDKARSKQVEGFILGGHADARLIEEISGRNIPLVLVNNDTDKENLSCVVADEFDGVRQVVKHLYQDGHRRIALFAGHFSPYIFRQRYQAFFELQKEYALEWKDSYFHVSDRDFDSATTEATKLLSQEEPPTAVFAANDILAAGVLKAAQRLGLSVPEDVALVGYDDSSICCLLEPELSSVHVDCYEMGKRAVGQLFAIMDGRTDLPRKISVPTQLQRRASSRAHTKHARTH